MKFCWLVLAVALPSVVRPYSSGPPNSVCESMTPSKEQHEALPQTTDSPYQLTLSKDSIVSGESIELTLSKIDPATPDFGGFMVTAVDSSDGTFVGKFDAEPSNVKVVPCGEDKTGGVSHNSPVPKSSMTLTWFSPLFNSGSAKKFNFFFTVVQERSIFWVKKEAKSVLTVEPSQGTHPIVRQTQDAQAKVAFHKDYEGCAVDRGCFGMENECVETGSCSVMVVYKFNPDAKTFDFTLHGSNLDQDNYIAMGLSADENMGDDLVFSCTNGADNNLRVGWNHGRNNLDGVASGVTFKNEAVSTVDKVTTCKFTIDEKLSPVPPNQDKAREFDLNVKHHLLLATGPAQNGKLSQHINRSPSSSPIDLKSASLTAGRDQGWLIQVHGCMMILAWLASAASGMLMARYYKQTWSSVKPLGKDFWFRFHQVFMVLAVVMTLIAFFVILAAVKGEPFQPEALKVNPHAVIGIICIICAFIQPIMAFFRPHPGTPHRWIFNWAHWFVGNTAFLFGIAAIFLSVGLPAPNLPQDLTHAMIAYVIVHFLVHVVLMLQRFYADKHANDPKNQTSPESDAPGSLIRKAVAGVYFLFVWVFAIAFVVIIVQARNKTSINKVN